MYEMWILGAIGLFVCTAVWRATRLRPLGRLIVKTLGSNNENLRTIAGISLTKAGLMAEPLLKEALRRSENLPIVLTILAGIGDKRVEPEIRRFSGHEDPQVAEAARQALRVLAMQR
jgi:hypothetical protein